VVNAGAFTNVDACETAEGFDEAMKVNYHFPSLLAQVCTERSATLVHFSSDYVFDGSSSSPYKEEDRPNPKSRYGVTKLLGDVAVSSCPHNYIIRTSWVYGEGKNFFNTILRLGREGQRLQVVNDQWGRPTSAMEIARFVEHLVTFGHDFGLYNFSLEGEAVTWHDLAASAFKVAGIEGSLLTSISTREYGTGKSLAPRPAYSVLDLQKTKSTGFTPHQWPEVLRGFIESKS
jgi:dTDP-4-dehydrorhamnose 3,5-epimerase